VSALAVKAGLADDDAVAALRRLQHERYELTASLSWFGDFASAVRHYAQRNFVVSSCFGSGATARVVTPSRDRESTCSVFLDAALGG
jgi:hypothetical protein